MKNEIIFLFVRLFHAGSAHAVLVCRQAWSFYAKPSSTCYHFITRQISVRRHQIVCWPNMLVGSHRLSHSIFGVLNASLQPIMSANRIHDESVYEWCSAVSCAMCAEWADTSWKTIVRFIFHSIYCRLGVASRRANTHLHVLVCRLSFVSHGVKVPACGGWR